MQYSPSLWLKTPISVFTGMFLSISLLLNIIFLLPLPRDTELLIGMLTGFILWITCLTLLMASRRFYINFGYGLLTLIVSAAINGFFLQGS